MTTELPPLAAIRASRRPPGISASPRPPPNSERPRPRSATRSRCWRSGSARRSSLRRPRQVTLTEVGERLAPAVTGAFDRLREAYADARGDGRATLVITTVPTFASNWLAKRLGSFQIAHPGIAVRIDTSSRMIDFASRKSTSASGPARATRPGVAAHSFDAGFTPMLSPRLAEGIREPADLLALRILDPDRPLRAAVAHDRRRARRRTRAGRQPHGLAGLRSQRGDGRTGRGDPDTRLLHRGGRGGPPGAAVRHRLPRRPWLLARLSAGAPQRAEDPAPSATGSWPRSRSGRRAEGVSWRCARPAARQCATRLLRCSIELPGHDPASLNNCSQPRQMLDLGPCGGVLDETAHASP